MRIHTNVLHKEDLREATKYVADNAPNIYVDSISIHGSRKRAFALEVQLRGDGERHTRRPNSGRIGASSDDSYAATYDDWGYWLAELYRIDPEMIVARSYDNADDFHKKTNYKYG
jgi:hypothetical protein